MKTPLGGATCGDYVQDKVRPGTGREGALGYERYIAKEHMDKVRPGTGREGALGYVRCDCVRLAQHQKNIAARSRLPEFLSI